MRTYVSAYRTSQVIVGSRGWRGRGVFWTGHTPSLKSTTKSTTWTWRASIFELSHFVKVFCWTVIQRCCSANAILVNRFSCGGSVAARAALGFAGWNLRVLAPLLRRRGRGLPPGVVPLLKTVEGLVEELQSSPSVVAVAVLLLLLLLPETTRCRWRRASWSCLALTRFRVRGLGLGSGEAGEAGRVGVGVGVDEVGKVWGGAGELLAHGSGELEKCGVDPLLALGLLQVTLLL